MIGIPVGMVFANAFEWFVHKHLLHGERFGRDRRSFWSFHWHDHHANSRRNGMIDKHYNETVFQWNGQGKEALALTATALTFVPLLPVVPFFAGTIIYSSLYYYRVHKKSHLDPEWAREHLPWHYDHHMGPNQDANWCVTRPWMDDLMGTREPYVGTDRERRDRDKAAARAMRKTKKSANAA